MITTLCLFFTYGLTFRVIQASPLHAEIHANPCVLVACFCCHWRETLMTRWATVPKVLSPRRGPQLTVLFFSVLPFVSLLETQYHSFWIMGLTFFLLCGFPQPTPPPKSFPVWSIRFKCCSPPLVFFFHPKPCQLWNKHSPKTPSNLLMLTVVFYFPFPLPLRNLVVQRTTSGLWPRALGTTWSDSWIPGFFFFFFFFFFFSFLCVCDASLSP